MRRLRVASAGVLLTLLTGCLQPQLNLLSTEPLTQPESTLQSTIGQKIQIVLPSTGAAPTYKWVLDEGYDKALLSLSGESQATNVYPSNPPQGYAPNRIFSFEALARGRTDLNFSQQPLNAGTAPSSLKLHFTVEIVASLTP